MKHSFKKLPPNATTKQRQELMIAAAGKISSVEIAELTGWTKNGLSSNAWRLGISLRCEAYQEKRAEERAAANRARTVFVPYDVTPSVVDALWKIPKLPKSIKRQVSNFT